MNEQPVAVSSTEVVSAIPLGTKIFAVVFLVIMLGVLLFDSLMRKKKAVVALDESLRTALKRRYDFLPELVSIVKSSANINDTLQVLVEAIGKARISQSVEEISAYNRQIDEKVKEVFMRSVNYPVLRENVTFLGMEKELLEIDQGIQGTIDLYNKTVMDYNIVATTFPSSLIAKALHYTEAKAYNK